MHIIWVFLSVFLLGVGAGGFIANDRWEDKWNKAEKKASEKQLAAVDAAVLKYNTRIKALEDINRDTEQKLIDAENSAAVATITADGLQLQLSDYLRSRRKCATNTPTTSERAAEATEQLVLTELFGRMERRTTGLAKVADDSRIRGLACESFVKNWAQY